MNNNFSSKRKDFLDRIKFLRNEISRTKLMAGFTKEDDQDIQNACVSLSNINLTAMSKIKNSAIIKLKK